MTRTEETKIVGICETEVFKCIRKGPFPKQVQCIFAINTLKWIGIYTVQHIWRRWKRKSAVQLQKQIHSHSMLLMPKSVDCEVEDRQVIIFFSHTQRGERWERESRTDRLRYFQVSFHLRIYMHKLTIQRSERMEKCFRTQRVLIYSKYKGLLVFFLLFLSSFFPLRLQIKSVFI